MSDSIVIRDARGSDAEEITALAIRSKAYWGYSREFMDACVEELSVTVNDIRSPSFHCIVAECEEKVAGFYVVQNVDSDEYELEALFVDADRIGTGLGRLLMDHAKNTVLSFGGKVIVLQGDPNAANFYRAAGGIQIGESESDSISGRFLPVFRIELTNIVD